MRPTAARHPFNRLTPLQRRGSVLIIVMWISLGLVTLALYFANSMSLELRAADNRCAGAEAEQAIESAARYVNNILANAPLNAQQSGTRMVGALPDPNTYQFEAVSVGDATFWVIGRGDSQSPPDQPSYGLVDEASKLNLNTATTQMLQALPRMTPDLAAAIIDWRSATSTNKNAATFPYTQLNPPYQSKHAPFESLDELRLVYGMDMQTLYGEDTNLNGVLDSYEYYGNVQPMNGGSFDGLGPGLMEYVTVYSREPNTRSDGSARINVNTPITQQSSPGSRGAGTVTITVNMNSPLGQLFQKTFGASRARVIMTQLSQASTTYTSLLDFYYHTGMTVGEFAQVEGDITVATGNYITGLVNVNTATATVLACLPGIDSNKAASLVAYRESNPDNLGTVAWVTKVLDRASAIQAGPYLTGRSYRFMADISAVGHYGRGYRRAKIIYDTTSVTSGGTPRIIYRQDLTHLGWALGKQARDDITQGRK